MKLRNYILLLTSLFSTTIGIAQTCGEVYTQAEEKYTVGKFQESINLIDSMKCKEFDDKVAAQILKIECLISLDQMQLARENMHHLMKLRFDYSPDNRETQLFADMYYEERTKLLQNSTSSVSKSNEDISLAPATMMIITEEDIRNRGYNDLEIMFHDLPGFDISKSMGLAYSNVFQRGHRSAANTDRTLILIDGIEDNDLWTNRVSLSRQYSVSNIKRVEVIHGPASTMYGPNAFLGVINVITKDESNLFKKNKDFGITANTGFGPQDNPNGNTWATGAKHLDVMAGYRFGPRKNMSLIATAKTFYGEEMNRSKYEYTGVGKTTTEMYWNYSEFPHDSIYKEELTTTQVAGSNWNDSLLGTVDSTGKIIPTSQAIAKARELDSLGVYSDLGNYTNPTQNYLTSIKLNLGGLKLGMQHWKREEGAGGSYSDLTWSGSGLGTIWSIQQTSMYLKFEKYIDRLYLQLFSRYKFHGVYPDTRLTKYKGYLNGELNLYNLSDNNDPYWQAWYFHQLSKQFRTELRIGYTEEKWNIIGGLEYRNSNLQGNYHKSKVDSIFSGVYIDSLNPAVNPDHTIGEHYNVDDYGAFVQYTWKDHKTLPKWFLTAGGRYDVNLIRKQWNYGKFNPRFSIVHDLNKVIFKTIYSEAFKDASFFNRYATSGSRIAGITDSTENILPEKVRNLDFSMRFIEPFQIKNLVSEIVVFRSLYDNPIELIDIPSIGKGQFQNDSSVNYLVNGGQFIIRYEHSEKLQFYGNATSTFSRALIQKDNSTYNNKIKIYEFQGKSDSIIDVGDIARFSFNLGGNFRVNEHLNVNLGMNHVGSKRTGDSTRIKDNPYTKIPAYTIFNATINYDLSHIGKLQDEKKHKHGDGLTIQLHVHNIFNLDYVDPGVRTANATIYAPILPQERRRFHLRLLYKF